MFFSERSLCCHAALTHTQAHHAPLTVRAPVPKLCLCVLNSSVISVGSDAGGAREGVMTIHGIWSLLGSLLERKVCYYEALAGRRVGIDASKWLHAFCSSKKNVMACVMRNDFTLVLKAFKARLEKFKLESVVPVFVFDGVRPHAKSAVDASRASSRADHLQKARQYFTSGDQVSALTEAQQAVTIPDVLVFRIVHEVLRPMGFAHVRAPGEADGQLASMLLHGIVDAVDSDDGDLMAHGVRELYSKVNYETGACTRYLADDWERSNPVTPSLRPT